MQEMVRPLALVVVVAGCGAAPAAPGPVSHQGGGDVDPVARACWLPDCDLSADLDGDGRVDRVELVRRGDDEGLRLALATGETLLVGAGQAVAPMPGADPEHEPIELEADLGFLVAVRVRDGAPPCPAQALMLSGEDAAVQLCVIVSAPRAFHLGF